MMFTKKGTKKKTAKGKPFGGKGAKPFAKKSAGGGVPSGSMPAMEDDTALDARIGKTFRGDGLPGSR